MAASVQLDSVRTSRGHAHLRRAGAGIHAGGLINAGRTAGSPGQRRCATLPMRWGTCLPLAARMVGEVFSDANFLLRFRWQQQRSRHPSIGRRLDVPMQQDTLPDWTVSARHK